MELLSEYLCFWENPGVLLEDISDPFGGLGEDYVYSLIRSYNNHCHNIRAVEGYGTCLNESKSLNYSSVKSTVIGKRPSFFARYKNFVRQKVDTPTKKFDLANFTFKNKINRAVKLYLAGKVKFVDLKRETNNLFLDIYEKAWKFGVESANTYVGIQQKIDTNKWFSGALETEMGYWNNFLAELKKNPELRGKKFSVDQRLDMYVKSVDFMFSSSKVNSLPRNVLIFWYPDRKRSGNMCGGCKYMVEHSPYPPDMMPTVPRAGDTPCLTRCLHKLVIRTTDVKNVEKRRSELPSKNEMYKQLQIIKKR